MDNVKLVLCGVLFGVFVSVLMNQITTGAILAFDITYQIVIGVTLTATLSAVVSYKVFAAPQSADSEDFGIFVGVMIPLLVIDIASVGTISSAIIGATVGLTASIGAIFGASLIITRRDELRPRVVLVTRCFVKDKQGKILIIKRSSRDSYRAGVWEVPGGKLDQSQGLSEARDREVFEETGLFVTVTDRDCFVESFICSQDKYRGIPYVAIFSVTKSIGGNLKLSGEHQAHEWLTYDELLDCDNLDITTRKAAIVLAESLK